MGTTEFGRNLELSVECRVQDVWLGRLVLYGWIWV